MKRAVTMKTIAGHAGVTQATVSMSLANNPRIPATTRERIQAIARKLGYRPNPYLSTLMRIRRRGQPLTARPVLALVNCLATARGWRDTTAPTIRQMREGAMARAVDRGYRTEEFWLHQDGMTNDRFSEMLYARGIQGLILSPLADEAERPQLQWEHFAAVSLSVPLPESTLPTVCNDHYFSALQAVRECHRLGYRRPGLVLRRHHRERFHGRLDAGFQVSRLFLPDLRLAAPLLVESFAEAARIEAWLEKEKPDVILSLAGEPLLGVLKGLGWRVPAEIGLASLACPSLGHAVSGIYQNGALIGATAVDTLISMIERNERGLPLHATTQMVEGVWNTGQTLRPARKPARTAVATLRGPA